MLPNGNDNEWRPANIHTHTHRWWRLIEIDEQFFPLPKGKDVGESCCCCHRRRCKKWSIRRKEGKNNNNLHRNPGWWIPECRCLGSHSLSLSYSSSHSCDWFDVRAKLAPVSLCHRGARCTSAISLSHLLSFSHFSAAFAFLHKKGIITPHHRSVADRVRPVFWPFDVIIMTTQLYCVQCICILCCWQQYGTRSLQFCLSVKVSAISHCFCLLVCLACRLFSFPFLSSHGNWSCLSVSQPASQCL